MKQLSEAEIQTILSMPQTKICAKCGLEKSFDEFNNKSSSSDGKSSYCKECNKENLKQHYYDNPQYYKDKSRKLRKEIRQMLDELKVSQGCCKCGFNTHPAALDFHHRDQAEKLFNVANSIHVVSRQRLAEEIAKCEIICANCHRIETWS